MQVFTASSISSGIAIPVEDGLIRSCAELNDVDFIISRDKDAFAGSTVRCVTAREYLTKVVEQDERRLGFAW